MRAVGWLQLTRPSRLRTAQVMGTVTGTEQFWDTVGHMSPVPWLEPSPALWEWILWILTLPSELWGLLSESYFLSHNKRSSPLPSLFLPSSLPFSLSFFPPFLPPSLAFFSSLLFFLLLLLKLVHLFIFACAVSSLHSISLAVVRFSLQGLSFLPSTGSRASTLQSLQYMGSLVVAPGL